MDKQSKQITIRMSIIYVLIIIPFLIIIGKVVYLETVERSFWKDLAKERNIELRAVKAIRGNIYAIDPDNNEKLLLATNIIYYDVYIDLGKGNIREKGSINKTKEWVIEDSIYRKDVSKLCFLLSDVLSSSGKSADDYRKLFDSQRKKQNRFVLIGKNITEEQLDRMKTMPILGKTRTRKINGKKVTKYVGAFVGAVRVIERYKRIYPYGDMARRTIGISVTANGCDTCFDGIDGFYSHYLAGKHGRRLERRINPNQWVPIDDNQEIKAIDGLDLISTLDVSLQELAEQSLLKCLDSNDAESGTVILMEVKTGYVKAIANFTKQKDGSYYERENIGVSDLLEPGSTFKIVTAMMMLDKGLADTSDLVPTGKKYYPHATKPIRDVKDLDHGLVSFRRAIEISSNVGVSQEVYNAYVKDPSRRGKLSEDLSEYFNFNRIGYDLDIYEPKPIIRKTKQIDDVLRMGFGYVSMMTPLQMLTFYNGIANNGKMMKPLFAKAILRDGVIEKEIEPVVIKEKMCQQKTLLQIQDMLKRVILYGTGKRLRGTAYGIAGKTGTAEIGYDDKKQILQHRASFVGYFPSEEPKYSCIVVISKPQKAFSHGGDLAAPVFRELSDRVIGTRISYRPKETVHNFYYPVLSYGNALNYTLLCKNLGFKLPNFTSNWIKCNKDNNKVFHYYNQKIETNVIPNVKGLTLRDAIYMLENMGVKVKFVGRGRVESQNIEQGQKIKPNTTITLTLSMPIKKQDEVNVQSLSTTPKKDDKKIVANEGKKQKNEEKKSKTDNKKEIKTEKKKNIKKDKNTSSTKQKDTTKNKNKKTTKK
ncbi:MAG: PASTA domain-containing protein [Bacteroidales bacterium]|nr:PASTA domain-containing protein [Bacteroidales bacterium]